MTTEAWTGVSAAMTAMTGGADDQVRSVAALIEHGWWRRFTLPNGQIVEHPSFAHFVRTEQLEGLGIHDPRGWARSLGEFSSYKKAADTIVRAIGEGVDKLGPHGGDGGSEHGTTNSENDADYVVARLKRDDPALADDVVAGKLTPHAAAKQAGIRRPRATFATDDVGLAVAQLLRFYDKAEILTRLGASP